MASPYADTRTRKSRRAPRVAGLRARAQPRRATTPPPVRGGYGVRGAMGGRVLRRVLNAALGASFRRRPYPSCGVHPLAVCLTPALVRRRQAFTAPGGKQGARPPPLANG